MNDVLTLAGHIFDRFIIHYYASAGVFLQVWFGLRLLRDWKNPKVPKYARKAAVFLVDHKVVLALVLLLPLGVWEYTNLQHGQTFVKGFFDFASWPLGYASTLWILKVWDRK